MSGKEDWFRQPCLSDEAKAEFERRLSRARSSRPEYLRIQAHSLYKAGAFEAALTLVDRILADYPDHLTAWIWEQKGDCLKALRQSDEALHAYAESLETMKRHRGVLGNAHLSFAALVYETQRSDRYEAALEYITEFWDSNPLFPVNEMLQFGWTAVLLSELGRNDDAMPPARRALAAAAKERSNAAKHRKLGLVGDGYPDLRKKLQSIVGLPFQKAGLDVRQLFGRLREVFAKTRT